MDLRTDLGQRTKNQGQHYTYSRALYARPEQV